MNFSRYWKRTNIGGNFGLIRQDSLFRGFITPKKVFNLVLVGFSYCISRFIRRVVLFGRSPFVTVEPTNFCNLSCPECPTGNGTAGRSKGYMDIALYSKIIEQCRNHCLYLNLYFQGEPLLHEKICDMVAIAYKAKIFTEISSNGQLLTDDIARGLVDSGLSRITFSVDSINQAGYERYRKGGSLHAVNEACKAINKWRFRLHRKNPQIIYQFVIFRHNENQLKEMASYAIKSGADGYTFKSAQILDLTHPTIFPSHIVKYSRYNISKEGALTIKRNKKKLGCWKIWSTTVITYNGEMVLCCMDKRGENVSGNIIQNSVDSIWKGPLYKSCRKHTLDKNRKLLICSNCIY
jgi:MoaA/NifB/PqqE/SkfB family radical SAM enzyme